MFSQSAASDAVAFVSCDVLFVFFLPPCSIQERNLCKDLPLSVLCVLVFCVVCYLEALLKEWKKLALNLFLNLHSTAVDWPLRRFWPRPRQGLPWQQTAPLCLKSRVVHFTSHFPFSGSLSQNSSVSYGKKDGVLQWARVESGYWIWCAPNSTSCWKDALLCSMLNGVS